MGPEGAPGSTLTRLTDRMRPGLAGATSQEPGGSLGESCAYGYTGTFQRLLSPATSVSPNEVSKNTQHRIFRDGGGGRGCRWGKPVCTALQMGPHLLAGTTLFLQARKRNPVCQGGVGGPPSRSLKVASLLPSKGLELIP